MNTQNPVIKDIYEQKNNAFENILIPFTDGIKSLQVVANLQETFDEKGLNIPESIEKSVTLAIIDDIWKEHLREMDELKQSVQNAVYEQKDPLLIYKFESFNLFKKLIDKINKDIVSFLMKADLPNKTTATEEKAQSNLANLETSRPEEVVNNQNQTENNQQRKVQPIRVEQKTERNAPCPCGSGKKYKKCHGR